MFVQVQDLNYLYTNILLMMAIILAAGMAGLQSAPVRQGLRSQHGS